MLDAIIPASYIDAFDRRRLIDPGVRSAVAEAMTIATDADASATNAGHVAVVPRGHRLPHAGELILEDGSSLGRLDAMPPDAPFGYHRLLRDDGIEALLITGPGRCHLPRGLHDWGWAIQLAATRSRASWGIGDLGDLRRLGEWSASVGAGFMAVGPLGAPNPGPLPEPSPYYPSTRRFGNPLHVRVDETPGAVTIGPELEALAATVRTLNSERHIDRAAVLRHKLAALERIRELRVEHASFDAWRRAQGAALERWARFGVLTERHGPGWQRWPAELHDPAGSSVEMVARQAAERLDFHAWIQWCFDVQLAGASRPLRRIADMPVGVDPGGFDAWDWQDQLALGASIGAPPDRFNAAGQDWGLPPFVPHLLRAAQYRPFIDTIRAQLRHAGGLRIDHVLGFFRLWCIPRGDDPSRGAYVHYPTDELLEIVALESHRAGAVIIGEDLGTVPTGVRDQLRRRSILSTRLALFERVSPARYPSRALAAITTHDLPTVAGAWSGSDVRDQAAAGVAPDAAASALLRRRLVRAAGVAPDVPLAAVTEALHRRLAAAPPMLVAATLEDALEVHERPNLPGTMAPARDNWSLALPVPIEELGTNRGVAATVAALGRNQ